MTNVVSLAEPRAERDPHLAGGARCLDCAHEWDAVAPVGTVTLECPSCGLWHGKFIGLPARDKAHWECGCGSDVFRLYADGSTNCARCGLEQAFD